MPSEESSQRMIARRNDLLREASEARDVDRLIEMYSDDAVFCNIYQNQTITGKSALHAFYSGAYAAIPTFKISPSGTNGTLDFVALEMTCEGTAGFDLPTMGLKAGEMLKLRGVSLFWWRWEGEGDEWNGRLDEANVKGWKIVKEHAYHQTVE